MKILLHLLIFTVYANSINAFNAEIVSSVLDIDGSTIEWVGNKVTGQHNGTLKLASGTVQFDGNKLQGGKFIFDMSSIENLDIESEELSSKLEDHLKAADFFDVDKFPTAVFEISTVEPIKAVSPGGPNFTIKGDLIIKGINHVVVFPATVHDVDDKHRAQGEIIVDRTLYNIRYKSGKFFEGLGDRMILDEFIIKFNIITE